MTKQLKCVRSKFGSHKTIPKIERVAHLKKPPTTIALHLNLGVLHTIIDIAKSEGISSVMVTTEILASKLEEFNSLPAQIGVGMLDQYIIMSPNERWTWRNRNTDNKRENHLAIFRLKSDSLTIRYLENWKKCDILRQFSTSYIASRIVERFIHDMTTRAERDEVTVEFLFSKWFVRKN